MTASTDYPDIKEGNHLATLFLPIPDGTALSYNLLGTTQAPASLETYNITAVARSNKVELIPVANWLKNPQRFQVEWKFDA